MGAFVLFLLISAVSGVMMIFPTMNNNLTAKEVVKVTKKVSISPEIIAKNVVKKMDEVKNVVNIVHDTVVTDTHVTIIKTYDEDLDGKVITTYQTIGTQYVDDDIYLTNNGDWVYVDD